jgi:hypothetical protein
MQDKRDRLFIITAAADTKVDLKGERLTRFKVHAVHAQLTGTKQSIIFLLPRSALSAAGHWQGRPTNGARRTDICGAAGGQHHKGSLGFAPFALQSRFPSNPHPPAFHQSLAPAFHQVPLGSVTPLAVAQPSAAGVALLLDAKLRGAPRIFVHPLDNTATVVLSPEGLEAFVRCGTAQVLLPAAVPRVCFLLCLHSPAAGWLLSTKPIVDHLRLLLVPACCLPQVYRAGTCLGGS